MNKEEIKYLIPIMQAFVDGKTIQCYNGMKWIDHTGDQCSFQFPAMFRIKPKEPTYHPFKDAEECWAEMQKHQPFGWIKSKEATEDVYFTITGLTNTCGFMLNSPGGRSFSELYDYYTFIDGTPFGVKEEE